jgi:two-component system, chemotaxis family, sensor kinase CheA
MSIDLSQFHGVFFEESFEGLEIMESELLDLELANPDIDSINKIFRAAHSIKGGGGSFGFTEITTFTHVLETLLDEIRSGKRNITRDELTLLLSSVDCIRDLMLNARDKTEIDRDQIKSVHDELERALGNEPTSEDKINNDDTASGQGDNSESEWHISFIPEHHIFQTGNDPMRMFRELEEFGELVVEVNISKLPPFDEYDMEECYLSWNLVLKTDVSKEQIQEVFAWVEDDCELNIEQHSQPALNKEQANDLANNKTGEATNSQPQAVPEVEDRRAGDRRKPQDRRSTDRRSSTESTSIRVNIDKIDTLINMVGELVITQSMLNQFSENFDIKDFEKLSEGLKQLERNTREIQENVMQIRMLPISFSFNRFPRLVHDLSSKLNKKIELKLKGETTELDKTVMEKIGDPLVHLVRNSIDHGIEMPEDRLAAGKPETGVIELNAYHEGGNIVIEIKDDGKGLNKERILEKAINRGLVREGESLSDSMINDLIFRPGFSTAEVVSDVSGRGVGMDVVRRNIHDLGGVVELESTEGVGSVFRIRLPLTLAIVDGQLVRVGNQTYVIPLMSIMESLQISSNDINSVAGKMELYRLREDYLPIIRLHNVFAIEPDGRELENGLLVIVESEGYKAGIFVDDLLAQQQVVIKSLETNYQKVEGVSGATILGDGTVAMILDISGLLEISQRENSTPPPSSLFGSASSKVA